MPLFLRSQSCTHIHLNLVLILYFQKRTEINNSKHHISPPSIIPVLLSSVSPTLHLILILHKSLNLRWEMLFLPKLQVPPYLTTPMWRGTSVFSGGKHVICSLYSQWLLSLIRVVSVISINSASLSWVPTSFHQEEGGKDVKLWEILPSVD